MSVAPYQNRSLLFTVPTAFQQSKSSLEAEIDAGLKTPQNSSNRCAPLRTFAAEAML